jgi:hypothetical protein
MLYRNIPDALLASIIVKKRAVSSLAMALVVGVAIGFVGAKGLAQSSDGPPPSMLEKEGFALTLLLCTPSEFNHLFVGTVSPDGKPVIGSDKEIVDHLTSLGFSNNGVQRGLALTKTLAGSRYIFGATANILHTGGGGGGFYTGPLPHPNGTAAKFIVKQLTAK